VSAEWRRALDKWAMRSESRGRLSAMVDVAGDEPGVYVRHTELNANPWLLNVMNGTLDLQTGELRPHRREDAITKISPVVYDPGATCPLWLSFLRRILPDPALRAFIQRAAGYSLTGLTIEQCLLFLFGTGANGKTTLIETLMGLLADYAQKAPTDMLMTRLGGSIPNDIARLPGARLVVAAEIESGRQMAESMVKDLTGGDTMVARFMRQEFFEFRPTHKLWMYGNHKPIIRGTDDGIWRRIHLVPFLVTIPEAEKDPGLVKRLNAELPGILKWAVDGCLAWQEKGLGIPSAVNQATGKYRAEMDVLGRFLGDCCHLEPRARVTKAALYEAYERWGGDLTKRKFGDALRERGFEDGRGSGNVAIWKGIGQLADDGGANAVPR
jgi:putative DNA primase/helicase